MTEARPTPQYGEYASPQEQAKVIARSLPPVPPVLQPKDSKTAVTPALAPPASAPVVASASGPAVRPRRRWDLALSIGMLAYAAVTILAGFSQYSDLPSLLNQVYAQQGIGTFAGTEFAATAGFAINASNLIIYASVLPLTVARLRARRIAFWIPLAGGVLAAIITGSLMIAVMVNDPTFIEYVGSAG